MDRVVTGISGLDGLLGGGFPAGSSILVTGTCGTGKSLFSLQYLVAGALAGEPGLYVTFEESKEKLIEHGRQFKWDIAALEKKKLLEIYPVETEDIGEAFETVRSKVKALGAKRLVLDSLTTMMEHGVIYHSQVSREMGRVFTKTQSIKFPAEGHEVSRKDVYYIVREINKLGTTSLLVSEVAEKSQYLSRDTVSEFVVDGVLFLEINSFGGKPERLLSVKKMRGTPVDLRLAIMEFTPKGIALRT